MVAYPYPILDQPRIIGAMTFADPARAIQAVDRNVALTGLSTSLANKPFSFAVNWTGTDTDPPATGQAIQGATIAHKLSSFNNGGFGFRGFFMSTSAGPLTVGPTLSAVTSTVVQSAPFPPGTRVWAPNTAFTANQGITNPNNQLSYYAVTGGTSAPSGTGPDGQGQAIVDGTVTWAYQGPAIPRYWAATTSYPNQGELVINPNNGGLFRVETPGTSGAFPGPTRNRSILAPVRLASTGNMTLSGVPIIDGVQSVIGDRVLSKDQTAPAENGIYIVASGAWARSADTDMWNELPSRFTSVQEGVVNGGTGYLCTVTFGGTLGTTPITWVLSAQPNNNAIPDGSVVWSLRNIGTASQAYIGLIANSQLSFNAGGKSFNETIGQAWGAVIGSRINANGKFYSASVGIEIDDRMDGSCRNINALKIVKLGNQAQFVDIGILLTAVVGSTSGSGSPVRGYKNAMIFNQSVDADAGYGISFESVGQFRFQHMAGAIDTRMVQADGATGPFGGGFLFRGPNGMYDQFGAWQLRYGSITPTSSGLTIDVTNQELVSIAITNGGTNWSVNDAWKGSDGSAGGVTSVDGSGGITGINYQIRAQVPSSAVPSTVILSPINPEAPFAALGEDPVPGTVGPTGDVFWPTAATGTPTYAAPATPTINIGTGSAVIVNMGRSGQATNINGIIKLGSDNQIANGTVATVLGSLGPVGSHTTVQEWLAIKNSSGVIRYVPCF